MSKVYNRTEIDGDLAVGRKVVAGGELEVKGKGRSVIEGSLKVDGYLDAPHIKGVAKGLFNSVEELKEAYSRPRLGWFAFVLDDTDKTKGILYKADQGDWVVTDNNGSPFTFELDSLNVLASKEELVDVEKRTESNKNTIHALSTAISNEIVRAVEREDSIANNALQYNSLNAIPDADKVGIGGRSIDTNNARYFDLLAATTELAGVMSAEDKQDLADCIHLDGLSLAYSSDYVSLYSYNKDQSKREEIRLKAANSLSAGVMTAEDKKALDNVPNLIKEEIAEIVGAAPEDLDSLEEVAKWLKNDETGTAAIAKSIVDEKARAQAAEKANADAIEDETTRAQAAEQKLQEEIRVQQFSEMLTDTYVGGDETVELVADYVLQGWYNENKEFVAPSNAYDATSVYKLEDGVLYGAAIYAWGIATNPNVYLFNDKKEIISVARCMGNYVWRKTQGVAYIGFSKGANSQSWTVPYAYNNFYLAKERLSENCISNENITPHSVCPEQTTFFHAQNMFNKNDENVVLGAYYVGTSWVSSSSLNTSGYIPVTPGESYAFSNNGSSTEARFATYYDSNLKFISYANAGKAITVPEGASFVRLAILMTRWDKFQMEQGTETTSYQEYKPIIKDDFLPQVTKKINISLPDKIYAVVGDTLQLFYRGMIQAVNPYNYNILVSCDKGKQYPRYFEYTPTAADTGTVDFKIQVTDDNGEVFAVKSCKLVTVNVVKSPVEELKVMCFGDSLTTAGVWCREADRRLTESGGTPVGNELTNIQFVGSKNNEGTGYFGVGGWSWGNYTTEGKPAYRFQVSGVDRLIVGNTYTNNGNTFTIMEVNVTNGTGNILCSVSSLTPAPAASGVLTKTLGNGDVSISYSSCSPDSQNPLWDYAQNKMTFIPYANKVSSGKIDVVYTLLSWNGHTPWRTDFTAVIEQIKVFADTLHAEFPNAKLKIMGVQLPSLNGGMGANYGATGTSYADGYGMVVTALNMNKAYQDFANSEGYSNFVEFVNVSSQFDSENNMPQEDAPVNTRSTATEKRGTNGVHPSNEGYLQIADVVYRNLIANFCQ